MIATGTARVDLRVIDVSRKRLPRRRYGRGLTAPGGSGSESGTWLQAGAYGRARAPKIERISWEARAWTRSPFMTTTACSGSGWDPMPANAR